MASIKNLVKSRANYVLISILLLFLAKPRTSQWINEEITSSSGQSTISTQYMCSIVDRLKNQRNRDSTRKNYHSVWRSFNNFFIRLDDKPDNWEDRIILFVGYLINDNKKAATIHSYVSAIKMVLLQDGIQVSEDKYLLASLTRASEFTAGAVRMKLPIRRPLLDLLLKNTRDQYLDLNQPYLAVLYTTMLSTAYFGLFRISEMTGEHAIRASDVHFAMNRKKILFILRSSKTHWFTDKPQLIKISSSSKKTGSQAIDKKKQFCPFLLIQNYLDVRNKYLFDHEHFIFRDQSPVTSANFRTILRMALVKSGLDPRLYGTQSLRAGRSVDMLHFGVPLSSIKFFGQWQSNAVYTYLKNL